MKFHIFNTNQQIDIQRSIHFKNEVGLRPYIMVLLFKRDGETIGQWCDSFIADESAWKVSTSKNSDYFINAWDKFLFPVWCELCQDFNIDPLLGTNL